MIVLFLAFSIPPDWVYLNAKKVQDRHTQRGIEMDNKVLDEAVETYLQVECQAINGDDTEYLRCSDRDREIVRAALLAGVKVLLGQPVAWALDGSLTWAPESRFHSETLVKLTKYKQEEYGFTKPLYAPSLGEGDGR